jgi:hypothetical protein
VRSFIICTFHKIFSSDLIKKNEMGETCSTYGERKVLYSVLVEKPVGKRTLGRTKLRWEDNIKTDLQKIECGARTGLMSL